MARASVAALLAAAVVGGCGLGNGPGDVEGPVTVYVSMPSEEPGRDAADGARLALEEADGEAGGLEVQARFLRDPSDLAAVALGAVGANARRAAQDSSTAAYIGELYSGSVRTSTPILNDAGIAQVSPGAGDVDLTAPDPKFPDSPDIYRPSGDVTFTRVIPSSAVVRAAAKQADAIVIAALSPGSLPPAGQKFLDRFRRRFGRPAGPTAAYGYEAMAVVLDAIEQRDTGGSNLRSSVVDSLLKVERLEESAIGPYSFTTEGDTTLCEVQVLSPDLKPLRTICPGG